MARKNQVYSQDTPRRTGLSASRITARMTPSATPKIIASTVTRIVPFQNPSTTGDWIIASKTKGQSNAGLLIRRFRNIAASTASTAMATHRPGWRCGLVDVAEGLELVGGLLDRVRDHGRVGQHRVRLARHDRVGGLVLAAVAKHLDVV